MAALESIMLNAVIDAHEGRDVMCADIPNPFIQAEMPDINDGEERVTMKITGVLVDMLVQLSPKSMDHTLCLRNSERSSTFKC